MTAAAWPGGRPGDLYAYLARYAPPDVGEWLATVEAVRATGRLLYVGIGTGRRAVELAKAGWTVHGVECDAAPLAALRERLDNDPDAAAAGERLVVEHARVEESAADGPFDAVLVPDLALAQTTDPDAQREVLAACAKRCRPGGAVLVDVVNPAPFFAALLRGGPVHEAGPIADTLPDGTAWRTMRIDLRGADARAQRFDYDARYLVEYADGDRQEFTDPTAVRWLSPAELRALALDVGLRMSGGSFDRADAPVHRVGFRLA